jgi:hypothetical protein
MTSNSVANLCNGDNGIKSMLQSSNSHNMESDPNNVFFPNPNKDLDSQLDHGRNTYLGLNQENDINSAILLRT